MRPRLLDLFCGAGGCSVGYARAGFVVTGVDIEPHPDYPYPMILGDAMTVLDCPAVLDAFDVIAASPPCPFFSTITPASSRAEHTDLLTPTLDILRARDGLYVVENVEGARRVMDHPVKLCGSSFGLAARRHRYFETNAVVMHQQCRHDEQGVPIGVYGKHADQYDYTRPDSGTSRGIRAHTLEEGREALGIGWMGWDDLTQAIPPAYTEYLGHFLIDQLRCDPGLRRTPQLELGAS